MHYTSLFLPLSFFLLFTTTTSTAQTHGSQLNHRDRMTKYRRAEFTLSNGLEAQKLNREFESLKADSACKAGEVACIDGKFASCGPNNKFSLTTCPSGLTCQVLPRVTKAGTTVTCDTVADAERRIAATGAKGGLFGDDELPDCEEGDGGNSTTTTPSKATSTLTTLAPAKTNKVTSTSAPAATSTSKGNGNGNGNSNGNGSGGGSGKGAIQRAFAKLLASVRKANAEKAQRRNSSFLQRKVGETCKEGATGCLDGALSKCVNGTLVTSKCPASTTCRSLPFEFRSGTYLSCETDKDTIAKMVFAGGKASIFA